MYAIILVAACEKNMYGYKSIFEHFLENLHYHTIFQANRQAREKKDGGLKPPPKLLLAERLAVCALVNGGVLLMGAHQDTVQRAVIFRIAVISTLLDGTFDALVCFAAHVVFLL